MYNVYSAKKFRVWVLWEGSLVVLVLRLLEDALGYIVHGTATGTGTLSASAKDPSTTEVLDYD